VSAVPLRVAVVDPSLSTDDPMWGDDGGGWSPPGAAWLSVLVAAGVPYVVVDDVDEPMEVGVTLVVDECGPPPDSIDEALAYVRDAMGALVRPDLRGVVLPRLDDPGSSMRRLLDGWRFDDVPAASWDALWRALEGFGTASVFCCSGWVHDDGTVTDTRSASPEEWRSLDEGVRRGVATLECHGHTHLHPDLERWLQAPDGRTNEDWYRELRPPMDDAEPSVDDQALVLAAWQRTFGAGSTVVPPGEAWGLHTLAAARRLGFTFLSSWGLCHLAAAVPTWTDRIVAPYLDEPNADRLAAGVPVVAYWHDRDMAVHGPGWAPAWLEAWRDAGATRAWSFARLADVFRTPIDAVLVDGDVVVRGAPAVELLIERP
jgi:hypothetical protein